MRLVFCVALALTFTPAVGSAQDVRAGRAARTAGDYATALREFRPLAEQGDVEAQYWLGFMYEQGKGVPQVYSEAVSWYRKAAEQGHAISQKNLGVLYEDGRRVPQDYVSAHMWFNLASGNGENVSSAARDHVAKKMTPEEISKAQQRAMTCRASDYQKCD